MDTKRCGKCHEHKPLQDFYRNSAKKDGRHYCCKTCSHKADKLPNRLKTIRKAYLKRAYGVTLERYDEMLASQNGGCAICHEPPPDGKNLFVDHDHKSGAVRALLCTNCNLVLGHAADSVEVLQRCVTYLTAHSEEKESA